ncbi:heterodisulfide reductase-related iron-sulfur binding cluster [Ilumatobacter sp.]|uniref:heterodisulfide reductase-related iron-sulfur binding cluster n=1 Tax=Ilumatobacter sp. TaxID=1967498 RepID=UPI003AF4698C
MTTPTPHDARYLDEKSVRDELTRTFDICGECRRCVEHCSVFPTLFELLDRLDGPGAGHMTPVDQDRQIDRCFHCGVCAVDCPYTPDRDERAVDVPRLMLRAEAMRRSAGHLSARRRRSTTVLGRTNLLTTAPFARKIAGAERGSLVRRIVQRIAGVSAHRSLPAPGARRFTDWFERRQRTDRVPGRRSVTVVPTCLVEQCAPEIGADLVRVLERNAVDCSVADVACCGAPWLIGGEVERFTGVAERNVRALAAAIRSGDDLVVPQPTCAHLLQRDYVDYVGPSHRDDATLLARHTFDAADYLMGLHRSVDGALDTRFQGAVPSSITHQVDGRLRARGVGRAAADLMRLTGAEVETVELDSADEVMWGLRSDRAEVALSAARRLGLAIERAGGDLVTGDNVLTNTTIEEQTGTRPVHSIEVLARAYGLPVEPSDSVP